MGATILFFFIIIPCAVQSTNAYKNNASDEQALLAFKSAIEYDQNNSFITWTPNISFCNWIGVTCSLRRQRVVSLNLSSVGLKEYGMGGGATTKGDVYSYGIILLEMVTGKKPTHNTFVQGMNLQKWVSRSFPNAIEEIADIYLLSAAADDDGDKVFNCLRQLISVGLLCTKEFPEQRPTMIDIVKILHGVKDSFLGAASIPIFQADLSYLLGSTNVAGENDDSQSSTF